MLTTAAGTVKPATALVLGVGVAGLQALATAKRLGARTTGYDVRPEVADQVRSLGAQWLDVGIDAAGEGGYARELTEDERARAAEAAERGDLRLRRGDHHRAGARPPGADAWSPPRRWRACGRAAWWSTWPARRAATAS